jgi:hypothetical protein
MFKALWQGFKSYTQPYPVAGVRTNGTANVVVDLVKQGLKDTIDTISVHLYGTIVVAGSGPGAATGAENPQGLVTLATLAAAPVPAGLTPINAIGSRIATADEAIIQGAFDTLATIPDTAGSNAIDVWVHYRFKRPGIKKAIEYAHPMYPWSSDVLTLVMGTRDQLYTGGSNTWDMTGVTCEIFVDDDVDANPSEIHATEIFETDINITSSNASYLVNTLPQGCFYDSLYFIAEDNGALSDAILNNISIQGGGRYWTVAGDNNADFVRQRYTKPLFYDPNGGAHGLTGLYAFALRDGLYTRGLDATSTPIVVYLNWNGPGSGHTFTLRIGGRKLVPGGIKKTVKNAQGQKTVIGLPAA